MAVCVSPFFWRIFLIFSLLLPFLSSYVVRMFSWQLWISNSRILAFVLRKLGMLYGKLSLLSSVLQ